MKTEQELRAQAQQQFQDYMQKKQQESGRELSDDDLEKVAGGFGMSSYTLSAETKQTIYNNYVNNCNESGFTAMSFDEYWSVLSKLIL